MEKILYSYVEFLWETAFDGKIVWWASLVYDSMRSYEYLYGWLDKKEVEIYLLWSFT